jgi:hypothetical protein
MRDATASIPSDECVACGGEGARQNGEFTERRTYLCATVHIDTGFNHLENALRVVSRDSFCQLRSRKPLAVSAQHDTLTTTAKEGAKCRAPPHTHTHSVKERIYCVHLLFWRLCEGFHDKNDRSALARKHSRPSHSVCALLRVV